MAYSDPRTWASGDLVTASALNQDLRDNVAYLKGIVDGVTFSGVKVTRDGGGSQSIPDSAHTPISFTAESVDYGGWWSSGSAITVPAAAIPSGYTTIAVDIYVYGRFVANGTGSRQLRVLVDGSVTDNASTSAVTGETTTVMFPSFTTVTAGQIITVEAYQSSGGALNLDVARVSVLRRAPVV